MPSPNHMFLIQGLRMSLLPVLVFVLLIMVEGDDLWYIPDSPPRKRDQMRESVNQDKWRKLSSGDIQKLRDSIFRIFDPAPSPQESRGFWMPPPSPLTAKRFGMMKVGRLSLARSDFLSFFSANNKRLVYVLFGLCIMYGPLLNTN